MAKSTYLGNEVLKFSLTAQSVTRPNGWKLGLFTGNPASTGVEVSAADDANYARQAATFVMDGNSAMNDSTVIFPAASAAANYAITHFGVFDNASGELLYHGELAFAKTVMAHETVSFIAGEVRAYEN